MGPRLQQDLQRYPAVALVGPRQCGKTTLAQSLGGHYFDLEDEADVLKLDLSWDRLIEGSDLVVLDEAQSHPPVFKKMRSAIDRRRRCAGRFLILGSVSPSLMREVSESLAGRLGLVELAPFFLDEVGAEALDALWLRGGFPDGGILGSEAMPGWQRNYLALLAQRDLPAWGLPSKPQMTERLFKMLAVAHGTPWNASAIGQSLGLNYQTVNSYMDYLEGAFLLRRLQPFHANVRKRLVKSPKVYWRDSGLLHALSGISTMDALLSQPWVGSSWEGFVIQQALSRLSASGADCAPYHLRTSDQHEIDLLLDFGTERWACEIKLTADPKADDLARLNKTADLIGAKRRILVSRTLTPMEAGTCASLNLPGFLARLADTMKGVRKKG
ncbi:MAG: ATP-binding protein [Lentisphaerae bacterium]|nr:ATP-binding protein [Lentisphaerota bacterium]